VKHEISPTRLALPLGLITLAVYLALLPWTTRVWLRTGDEPHYLIAAHSLAYDGDFDLSNNYDPDVYQNWYTVADIGRQVRIRADGAQFLVHTYGLPLLLAPVYRLFGVAGVPYFLAALGALLAANVYLLGLQVTGDWRASTVGWFVVAFAPPLIWYVFLIYPEMVGALCVTLAVRVLLKQWDALGGSRIRPDRQVRDLPGARTGEGTAGKGGGRPARPGDGPPGSVGGGHLSAGRRMVGWLLFGFCLAALPWLSARFIPAMATLAALAAWLVLRRLRDHAARIDDRPGRLQFGRMLAGTLQDNDLIWPIAGLLLTALGVIGFSIFNSILYGNPAPTASYTVPLARPNASWHALLQLVRGLMGWLIDQQRGLLVTGPLYFLTLVGLGQWLRQRAWGALVVAATFGAALFSISLLGGFWIGVEPAARYLVHVLPPLGAALAYAWAHRRGPWLAILTASGAVVSLLIGWTVFRQPLLAQTDSLIANRAPRLVSVLPALGRNIYLPTTPGDIAQPEADGTLKAPAGSGGIVFRQDAIPDFSFGWYEARIQLAAREALAGEPVARVLIQGGDRTRLLQAILTDSDFPADGSLRTFTFPIYNPVFNQWEQPGAMWIFSTGNAELRLGQVSILPAPFQSLVLPAVWLVALALFGVTLGAQHTSHAKARPAPGWLGSSATIAGAALLAVGAAWWSLQPLPRIYGVGELRHFTGTVERDGESGEGQVLIARPALADSPGVLASTRAQFYPPGPHAWRLRLKAGSAPGDAVVARARLYGARQPASIDMVDIHAAEVPADGQFHVIELVFDNPLEQALVFELEYTALTDLATDRFQVWAVR
jgi:hypothetical protein